MGQAKARGTFEQRKAQAVEAGRVKRTLPLWHWLTTVTYWGGPMRVRQYTDRGGVPC